MLEVTGLTDCLVAYHLNHLEIIISRIIIVVVIKRGSFLIGTVHKAKMKWDKNTLKII